MCIVTSVLLLALQRLGLFLGRSGVALPTNVPLSMLSGDDFGDGVLVVLHRGEVLPPQIQVV